MSILNWRYAAPSPQSYIFLIAGQSNAVGRGETYDAGLDTTSTRITQLKQTGQMALATEPLDHVDPEASDVGFGLAFGRSFIAANDADIKFVPCAQGGTSFSSAHWNVGNGRLKQAIDRTNFALRSDPQSVFGGVLWHQGEGDATNSMPQATHSAALDAMIAEMRASIIAPSFPFILGGLSEEYYVGTAAREAIQASIVDTPNRVANCVYVSSSGLTGNVGDVIHFDAASQRLFGPLYYAAWDSLR